MLISDTLKKNKISLPVGVGEHLHDRVDEGLPSIMRGPVSVPLSHAPHKKDRAGTDFAWLLHVESSKSCVFEKSKLGCHHL